MNKIIEENCVMCGNMFKKKKFPNGRTYSRTSIRKHNCNTCSSKCSKRYLDIARPYYNRISTLNAKIKLLQGGQKKDGI